MLLGSRHIVTTSMIYNERQGVLHSHLAVALIDASQQDLGLPHRPKPSGAQTVPINAINLGKSEYRKEAEVRKAGPIDVESEWNTDSALVEAATIPRSDLLRGI